MMVQAMIEGWLPSRAMMPAMVSRMRCAAAAVKYWTLGISVQISTPSRSATS
jgi:hypothetical protein